MGPIEPIQGQGMSGYIPHRHILANSLGHNVVACHSQCIVEVCRFICKWPIQAPHEPHGNHCSEHKDLATCVFDGGYTARAGGMSCNQLVDYEGDRPGTFST